MNYGKHHISLLQAFSKKKNTVHKKDKGEAGLGKVGNAIIDDTENSKMPYLFTH